MRRGILFLVILCILLIALVLFYDFFLYKRASNSKQLSVSSAQLVNPPTSNSATFLLEPQQKQISVSSTQLVDIDPRITSVNQIAITTQVTPEVEVVQNVPVNVRTRGSESYRQIGLLHEIDSCGNKVTNPRILPLFGRRTYPGSNKWNFYTTTDGYNLLTLPVFYKNKDCTDAYGCDDVFTGDELYVQEYQSLFHVRLYQDQSLQYIPYVL